MNYEVDIKNMWKGVGQAGKLIRILWLLALAKLNASEVFFTDETLEWWGSSLKPYNNPKKLNDLFQLINPHSVLKQKVQEEQERESLVFEVAKEYLVPNCKIKERFDKLNFPLNYFCIYIRGTDKITETIFFPESLHKKLYVKHRKQDQQLIVISDSEYFYQQIAKDYPCRGTDSYRSTNETPLHLHRPLEQNIQTFQDCMVDLLALAGAETVVYNPSMMIQVARLVNPNIHTISVESILDEGQREVLKETTIYLRVLYQKWCSLARKTSSDII